MPTGKNFAESHEVLSNRHRLHSSEDVEGQDHQIAVGGSDDWPLQEARCDYVQIAQVLVFF